MYRPRIGDDPLYQLLREEKVEEFNRCRTTGGSCALAGTDLSRLDLRGLDAAGLDLSDCYFRGSDLRGIDFRKTKLEGASFATANVSGCYFPRELSSLELELSISQGIRVRYG